MTVEFDDKCWTQIIDGERYSILRDPDIIWETLRFQPGKDDVVLMTYPTSGTHWMQQIMQLIVYRGRSVTTHSEFRERSPFIEDYGKRISEVTTHSHPRILTTHFKPGKLAINQSSKYVYVARNPWDLCASLYEQCQQTPLCPLLITFEEFLPMFLRGYMPYGSYFPHVNAGYALRNEQNVFFVTYEEIAEDTAGVVVRLAEFLGSSHGRAVREDAELLSEIIRKCRPDFMKELMTVPMEHVTKWIVKNKEFFHDGAVQASSGDTRVVRFVRSAKVGRWRELFSKEQLRQVLVHIDEIGDGAFVKQLWSNIWQEVAEASQ